MRNASFLAVLVTTLLAACSPCPHASQGGVTVVPSERDVEYRTKLEITQAEIADAKARAVSSVIDAYLHELSQPPAPGFAGTAKVAWPPEIQGGLLRTQKLLNLKMRNHIHNLSNIHTVAYKRTRMNFAGLPYQKVTIPGSFEPGAVEKPATFSVGMGVHLVSTDRIFDQGSFHQTQRDLDLALDGEGFFRVLHRDGYTTVYTRNGNFHLNEEGNIVTNQGYLLDPPIGIPQNVTRLFVDTTGLVQGFDPDSPQDLVQIGQIELARFVNPTALEPMGDNLYRETTASGKRIDGQAGLGQGFGILRQGFLEQSNVDVFDEVLEFTQTLRLYRTLRNLQK